MVARLFMVYGPDWVFLETAVDGPLAVTLARGIDERTVDIGTVMTTVCKVVETLAELVPGSPAPQFGSFAPRPNDQVRAALIDPLVPGSTGRPPSCSVTAYMHVTNVFVPKSHGPSGRITGPRPDFPRPDRAQSLVSCATGSRYKSTASRTSAMNCGSLESLNVAIWMRPEPEGFPDPAWSISTIVAQRAARVGGPGWPRSGWRRSSHGCSWRDQTYRADNGSVAFFAVCREPAAGDLLLLLSLGR